MQHIERIVWKPINWLPESPDQYPDGLPRPKPEMVLVEVADGRVFAVMGYQMGETVQVHLAEGNIRRCRVPLDPIISIPASSVQDLVDALLYIHRRTHEHEYEGPDAGIPTEP